MAKDPGEQPGESPQHSGRSSSEELHHDQQEQHEDWISSSGSSSDEEADVDTRSEQHKPNITTSATASQNLKSRLTNFLPQIAEANAKLQDPKEAEKHSIDNVANDQGQYIEMNLGLGVLTEKKHTDDIQTHSTDSDDSDSEPAAIASEPLVDRSKHKKIEEM